MIVSTSIASVLRNFHKREESDSSSGEVSRARSRLVFAPLVCSCNCFIPSAASRNQIYFVVQEGLHFESSALSFWHLGISLGTISFNFLYEVFDKL